MKFETKKKNEPTEKKQSRKSRIGKDLYFFEKVFETKITT